MYQLSTINEAIHADPAAFVARSDAAYQRKIENAADRILENLKESRIVLLSGPSGSGKTTTAMKIRDELKRRGVNSYTVSMDDYFLTLNPATCPRTEKGDIDFESPLCLDRDLLADHFDRLEQGEEVMVPKFIFSRQMRDISKSTPLRLRDNEVAIFEGIHALNDDIAGRHPAASTLYISARSDIEYNDDVLFKRTWLRLCRRAVRDFNFRGTNVAETVSMWANVRRGEMLYISPFKNKAKIIFDTFLPYEVSVMKTFNVPFDEIITEDNARRGELLSLASALEYFEPIDPALVPADSLLREFIGGGSYHY